MPGPATCTPAWCGYKSTCAYSNLPRNARPTVKDWEVKPIPGKWEVGHGTDIPPMPDIGECKTDPQGETCFSSMKRHSYLDMKRGLQGGVKDGELVLRLRHTDMMQCRVVIDETKIGWNKLKELANWEFDIDFTVNGKPLNTASSRNADHNPNSRQAAR